MQLSRLCLRQWMCVQHEVQQDTVISFWTPRNKLLPIRQERVGTYSTYQVKWSFSCCSSPKQEWLALNRPDHTWWCGRLPKAGGGEQDYDLDYNLRPDLRLSYKFGSRDWIWSFWNFRLMSTSEFCSSNDVASWDMWSSPKLTLFSQWNTLHCQAVGNWNPLDQMAMRF